MLSVRKGMLDGRVQGPETELGHGENAPVTLFSDMRCWAQHEETLETS